MDPRRFPNEDFDLYSIPAYDSGKADVVPGEAIGSAKQVVEPNDVLLSRIVPHIRRAWVVGPRNGHRQIASGEWIIFREKNVHPQYLRHVLLGDDFHSRFMMTVAGVGGSLMRARPKHVAEIAIPLPAPSEQRRIAAILDQADALRAKRRAALALLDEMAQAIFVEMFGPDGMKVASTKTVELSEVVRKGTIVTYGIVQAGEEFAGGVPYIRTGDIVAGEIRQDELRHTDPAIAAKFRRSRVSAGDIVMSIRATVGTTAIVPKELDGANLTQGTARIAPGESVSAEFLLAFLRLSTTQEWISRQVKGATFREITLSRLRELPVAVPPLEVQTMFGKRLHVVSRLQQLAKASSKGMDSLFASLQHRAFRGEL